MPDYYMTKGELHSLCFSNPAYSKPFCVFESNGFMPGVLLQLHGESEKTLAYYSEFITSYVWSSNLHVHVPTKTIPSLSDLVAMH